MSASNPAYKTQSGNSLIYRFVKAKYFRRDKDGKLTALVSEYRPLPPFKKKKKKVVKADPAMNAYRPYLPVSENDYRPYLPVSENATKAEAKSFFTNLRELFK
jgi:hypothetical protein